MCLVVQIVGNVAFDSLQMLMDNHYGNLGPHIAISFLLLLCTLLRLHAHLVYSQAK